jgi:hypothetical protein
MLIELQSVPFWQRGVEGDSGQSDPPDGAHFFQDDRDRGRGKGPGGGSEGRAHRVPVLIPDHPNRFRGDGQGSREGDDGRLG